MGSGNFDVKAYKVQAEKAKVKQNSGFTAVSMCDEFNPSQVNMRFSKRGPFNEFRDVITVLIGLDVTGSMDIIPKSLLEGRLGSLMVDLKKTFSKPNENLQLSFAGIGDAKSDEAPLQVTHFESDNRFAQQLQKIWLEGHGGGNGAESYNLLWWYAANKTHLNYVRQDKRKGILITIGDDNVHPELTASEIQMWLDPKYQGGNISNQVLLDAVREQYDVYHIVITNGTAYNYNFLKKADKTEEDKAGDARQWIALLGEDHVIYTQSDGVADAISDTIKRHRPLEYTNTTHLSENEWEKQNKENLTDKQWEEVLSYALCPLTRKFMIHPAEWNGHKKAYEKDAVEEYVKQFQKDPITLTKLLSSELILKPNLNIAQLCSNYRPFFDALPPERSAQLILNVLGQQVEHKKSNLSPKSPRAFFAQSDAEQTRKKLEKMHVSLECPITGEIMEHPVILIATGQSYDKTALDTWLEKHDTDPISGAKLNSKATIPNFALQSLCDQARSAEQLN